MVSLETPVCEFGKPAIDFNLPGTDGKNWSLKECMGKNGLLVMFICNHCPYVKAVRNRIVRDAKELKQLGIESVAIMANDIVNYPEDSFENMKKIAEEFDFSFPYLLDETQEVAKAYGAVCTPDFFGFDQQGILQYRGRLDSAANMPADENTVPELFNAMLDIKQNGISTEKQYPSMGCSIKWKN